ncbi:hypothetical protein AMATHDRAFT_49933 [Amanita thiersii Skay4041]|uniref:Uncharacterized protein n=1 Tax=Amanita thiersii Skay4041 TaxID=703135 RepID=A0A2A9NJG4_9AGAR|nr:hypothetical protein AMATHDRAFT_49933 [Amanita thiersii Skay4041]
MSPPGVVPSSLSILLILFLFSFPGASRSLETRTWRCNALRSFEITRNAPRYPVMTAPMVEYFPIKLEALDREWLCGAYPIFSDDDFYSSVLSKAWKCGKSTQVPRYVPLKRATPVLVDATDVQLMDRDAVTGIWKYHRSERIT